MIQTVDPCTVTGVKTTLERKALCTQYIEQTSRTGNAKKALNDF